MLYIVNIWSMTFLIARRDLISMNTVSMPNKIA